MTELDQTIDNVGHCAVSLKTVLDQWVTTLLSMKEQSLKVERDLQQKEALALERISGLRSQIQQLDDERMRKERQLALVREKIEKEQRDIGRERERFRKLVDDTLAGQTA